MTQRSPYVCFQLFTLHRHRRYWAFRQMGLPPHLQNVPGLRFWKRLGTGAGEGFSIWPDWQRYAVLTVWESEAAGHQFMQQHAFSTMYQKNCREYWWAMLQPVKVHGQWSGQNPFLPLAAAAAETEPLVVLTRANIRLRQMLAFWKQVPDVSKAIAGAEGLRCKIGIGEYPLLQQATISVWENAAAIRQFAYQGKAHSRAVHDTQRLQWYSEELFARFRPVQSGGLWNGLNPLAEFEVNSELKFRNERLPD